LAVGDFSVLHVKSLVTVLDSSVQRTNGEGTRCKSGTVPPL
jgi:hypothetical protein